jgi:hypothetical protein
MGAMLRRAHALLAAASLVGCIPIGDTTGTHPTQNVASIVVPLQVLAVDAVPAPVRGKPYPRQLPAAGGRPPYAWKGTGGALPAGLVLEPSGLLTGTPEVLGPFSFDVTVTDSAGASATGSLADKVRPSGTVPFHLSVLSPMTFGADGFVGFEPFVLGGTPPYAFTCEGLPPGIACDAATGTLYGAATTTGPFAGKLRMKDARGVEPEGSPADVTIVLEPPQPIAQPNAG